MRTYLEILTLLRYLVVLALLAGFTVPVVAQDQDEFEPGPDETTTLETAPAEPVPVIRPSLLIVDSPTALAENIDPIQSQPTVLLPDADDPEFRRRMESIDRYSTTVADIEFDGGAWDRGLVQELTSLGNLYQQQGAYVEAAEVLSRAMHVNRVNSGLHTLEQIPAVQGLIDSYIAMGDWEQADLYHDYLFYVQQRAYGSADPRMIPVLDSLANWNLQAFNVGYGEALGLRLTNAQLLFGAAARMVQAHFGKQDERFVSYLKSLAGSSYLVYRNPQLIAEARRPEYRTTQDLLRERLNEIGPVNAQGFRAGESAIEDIIEHYRSQDSVYEHAEAVAYLGDWYLLFDRRRAARNLYAEAWQLLSEEDDGVELQQQMFGSVVPLPSFTNNDTVTLTAADSEPQETLPLTYGYADVLLDVSSAGAVRNIRLLTEETELNTNILSKLRRQVRSSFFRPVIVDGRPVSSSDHRFRYRYWY